MESLGYLIEYLWELGPMRSEGLGYVPVSWLEIDAWNRLRQVSLDSWEARVIHLLSVEYCQQIKDSTDPGCPPPYEAEPEPKQEVRDMVDAKLRAMFQRFKKK